MNAYQAHQKIISLYRNYLHSFLNIVDERLKAKVEEALRRNELIPEPLIQFNPSYERAETLDDLIEKEVQNLRRIPIQE